MYEHLPRSNSTESDLEPLYIEGEEVRVHHRKIRNFLAGIFVAVFAFALVVGLIFAAKYGGAKGNPKTYVNLSPVVNTTCGWVVGLEEDDIYVFKGLPYAAPPVDSLRWKPPKNLPAENKCWTGTYRAYEFGFVCAQFSFDSRGKEGEEDCLFLNIWTPQVSETANLPVMVYIHGGYLLYGSGNDKDVITSADVVKAGNVVIVSMNYRLNAFGFLALEMLSLHSVNGTSGNYGLMDQIMALTWVKDNIRAFGGNPNLVTVFGLGSGGTSILGLLSSPWASGLFHRAWTLSASPWWVNKTLHQVEKDNLVFLNNTGCDSIHCLYRLSTERIINAIPFVEFPSWSSPMYTALPIKGPSFGAVAVVDGYVIPKVPLDAWRAGYINDVPLLLGNVDQEADYLLYPHDISNWNWDNYETYVRTKLTSFDVDIATRALQLYGHQMAPEFQLASMVSDMRIICPTNELAKVAAESFESPVFRYVVSAMPSAPVFEHEHIASCAYHGWDLSVFFGRMHELIKIPKPKDKKFADNLRQTVFNFVRYGTIKKWDPVPEQMVVFSSEINFEIYEEYKRYKCDLWMNTGYFYPNYTWVN